VASVAVGGQNSGDDQLTSCAADIDEHTSAHVLSDGAQATTHESTCIMSTTDADNVNGDVIRALQAAREQHSLLSDIISVNKCVRTSTKFTVIRPLITGPPTQGGAD